MGKPIYKSIIAVIIVFTVFGTHPSIAQLKPGNLTRFTEQDGVPGSRVGSVLVDKFGYIWLGTINGLARYDGYEFKRFYSNPNDTASIKGLIVWSLFQDRQGNIWTSCSPGYLNMYSPISKSFRHYNFDGLISRPSNIEVDVTSMCQDDKGRMYFGITTYYGDRIKPGLLYLDEKDDKIKQFVIPTSLETNNVIRTVKDKTGNIWLLSYNGLYKINTNRKLSKNYTFNKLLNKKQDYAVDLKPDKDGHIWLITYHSDLYDFNPQDSSYKVYSLNNGNKNQHNDGFSNNIVLGKNDNIWIGTNAGLHLFNNRTKKFEELADDLKKELSGALILDMKFDSFGTLWVGTMSEGLFKFEDKAVLKSYSFNRNEKGSLTPGWANQMCESNDGKIWVATTGADNTSGLNEFDTQTGSIHPFPYQAFQPNANIIFGLIEISPGEFYISTAQGHFIFIPANNTINKIKFKGVPDSLFIFQFFKDGRGNLWLCTNSGLYRTKKVTEGFTHYDLSKLQGCNASSNEITKAFESKKHGLWLLTNEGLFLFDYKTDKIVRHGFDKKAGDIFVTQDVNSFCEDSHGTAWVGTWEGGLSMYNVETGKIKTFTRNDGLPSMSVQGILADEDNHCLWLSTFDGLSRFNLTTNQFNNYSIADGIQSQLFADGSYLKTTQGKFIFGGSNGITVFSASDVDKKSIPPIVFLTDLKLYNKLVVPGKTSILKNPIYDTREIILPYDQNNISIEFIALHYSNPSKNKCAYKLENYDNEWREVGNQHVASYPMLPPGKYIFRVKAANNNGVWNEHGASLQIIINPPWWKTNWAYAFYILLIIAGIFAANRFFRNRVIRKERERTRTRELEQAKEIEKAYRELKATQSQLIQSEKMASLGELTAGIAHEIQNPLNFVNNFSEVNAELIDEMQQEMDNGNLADAKAISNDIKENEQKINHHGKRADAIVKGMLQHSRNNSGVKEPSDINLLADEYLRLAYHGLRAKDKSFNATMKTDFDETIGMVNIIPQDIGRVILNLITNAFYAVTEKKKQSQNGYEPTVSVTTKKEGNLVLISVRDNGNGIPQKVLDKIFQPFFTTKPAGQGTGLGLSMSYDIVKAHGGELKVETWEGEGTEFIIQLLN